MDSARLGLRVREVDADALGDDLCPVCRSRFSGVFLALGCMATLLLTMGGLLYGVVATVGV